MSKDTKHWVLTAWDNDKETDVYATVEGNGSIGATAATPMLTRRNGVDTAVSKQSLSNEGEIVKQKFSFDDEDYMFAVEAGDMDAAQEMVDEAAQNSLKNSAVKRYGKLLKMFYGTSKGGFTIFDTYGGKFGLFGIGSYFTDNKEVAASYTENGTGRTSKFMPLIWISECQLTWMQKQMFKHGRRLLRITILIHRIWMMLIQMRTHSKL